jgi:hypothetical protein
VPKTILPERPDGYTVADALVLTSATKSNLHHWTREGVIVPDFVRGGGRGVHSRFSTVNLIEIQICAVAIKYRVEVSVLKGMLSVFRLWHRGAVAMYESGIAKQPFLPEPWRLALFKNAEARKNCGIGFLVSHGPYEEAARVVTVWRELRTSTHIGRFESKWDHFVGLVFGETYGHVVVDPPGLVGLFDKSAILIDLVDVAFSVSRRVHDLSLPLKPW